MHLIVSSQRSRKFSCSTVRNFSCKRPDMQVKLRWHRSMSPQDAKLAFARAIQAEFKEIVRKNKGKLAQKAAEIGVERQQLEQYATGSLPRSDVILTAMIKWGLRLRIEDPNAPGGEPKWWECGMSGKDGVRAKSRPLPVQLPLFKAIEHLGDKDTDVRILRKEPGRIRLAVDILFKDKIG